MSFIAGLGGVLYGYDMGIIAAALIFVSGTFRLTTQMQEVVVSVVTVRAMLWAIMGAVWLALETANAGSGSSI